MATFNQTIASGEDCLSYDASTFDATPYIGRYGPGADQYNIAGFRVTGVTIPQGATINAVTMSLPTAGSDAPSNVVVDIYGEKVADAAAWSDPSRTPKIVRAGTVTTATVHWVVGSITNPTTLNVPSLVAIIQELVNQGSWASGNDLVLLFDCASQTLNNEIQIVEGAATISIDYTAGGGGGGGTQPVRTMHQFRMRAA